MNSLVIAPQWIGDAVMTEPLLQVLAARGERLTVGALPWVAPVYRAMPQVAEVIEFPFQHGGLQWAARRALARELQGRFARAYICPNSLKSALLPWWADVPERVGYQGESRWGLITRRLPNPSRHARPPMVAHYLALAGADAVQPLPTPRLHLSTEVIAADLSARGLVAGHYVVMAPGAEYGEAKRWPLARFAELASHLTHPVVLLGSGKETSLCHSLAQQVAPERQSQVHNLAGRTTLWEAFALIAGAHRMVSNDSGLMHVAAALGVPQVAVFGSSSPLHTPPLNPRATVVWLKNAPDYAPALDCAPCFKRSCPLGHMRCLNDVGVERVLRALS